METLQIVGEFFVFLGHCFQIVFEGQGKLLIIAALLGSCIGLEREIAGKDPSLRTFAIICLGSCLFAIISKESVSGYTAGDPSRIAAQVVTGIGFLGAGAIFRSERGVSGLTTASLMWVTAAIGLAVGFNLVRLACATTIAALIAIYSLKLIHQILRLIRPHAYTERTDSD